MSLFLCKIMRFVQDDSVILKGLKITLIRNCVARRRTTVQIQLISYNDNADFIPREVAIMYFKTEGIGHFRQGVLLGCMAYTTNRVRHKIKCVPTKELHAYETCRKQKNLAVFLKQLL